ncbi:MAG: DUF1566 domain-containing protein [Acidimicrobiia bacterium]
MTASQPLFRVLVAALALGWAATAAADFPATGQTTCYDSLGNVIDDCTGTGQDGDIQAGATLKYKDKNNGTITDQNTGRVWEKKSDDNTIHDKDNPYTWDEAFAEHVFALKNMCQNDETVDCSVNGNADCALVGGKCGFAGKRDWRVPNVKELQSIVDYGRFGPSIDPIFGPTAASFYWSSTTYARASVFAWNVGFLFGDVVANGKSFFLHVRAVRGGS